MTTTQAAKGVIRALWDHGIAIGRDFLVASIGDEGDVRYMTPSLTALELPDLQQLVRQTMTWMLSGDKTWNGALKVGEEAPRLFIGETTRPERPCQESVGNRKRGSHVQSKGAKES